MSRRQRQEQNTGLSAAGNQLPERNVREIMRSSRPAAGFTRLSDAAGCWTARPATAWYRELSILFIGLNL